MGALKNFKKYKTEVDHSDDSDDSTAEQNKMRIHSLKQKISAQLEKDENLQKRAAVIIENLMNQK